VARARGGSGGAAKGEEQGGRAALGQRGGRRGERPTGRRALGARRRATGSGGGVRVIGAAVRTE
jgi:hypothetical protein